MRIAAGHEHGFWSCWSCAWLVMLVMSMAAGHEHGWLIAGKNWEAGQKRVWLIAGMLQDSLTLFNSGAHSSTHKLAYARDHRSRHTRMSTTIKSYPAARTLACA